MEDNTAKFNLTESNFSSSDAADRPDSIVTESANLTADDDRRALISTSVQTNLMSDVAASIVRIAIDARDYTTKSILYPTEKDSQNDVLGDSNGMPFESVLTGDSFSENDQSLVKPAAEDLSDDNSIASEVDSDAAVQGEDTAESVAPSENDNRRTLRAVGSSNQMDVRGVFGFISWAITVLLFASCCVCIRRVRTQAVLISQGISPEHGIYRPPMYGVPPGVYASSSVQVPPPWAPYPTPQAPPQKAEV